MKTNNMNLLIIEDEPRAANQLKNMLIKSSLDFNLLGILDSVEESIKWLKYHPAPDLIFMDIQLADGLSFEIFQHVEVTAPIIFTTAFDQYAIQAFKVNSIDYLLKPIKKEDLEFAIQKFKNTSNPIPESSVLKQLLTTLQTNQEREGILVKEGNSYIQIRIDEILYIYSEDSVTFAITEEKRYVVNETIDQLNDTLSASKFFRINRGQVISKKAIIRIEPYLNHRLKVSIKNSRNLEFVVSRQRSGDFKEWLNK